MKVTVEALKCDFCGSVSLKEDSWILQCSLCGKHTCANHGSKNHDGCGTATYMFVGGKEKRLVLCKECFVKLLERGSIARD